MSLLPSNILCIMYHCRFPFRIFRMEGISSTLLVFLPDGVFYLVITGWISTSACVRNQSINLEYMSLIHNSVISDGHIRL